jgi:hypothetical protein
MAAAPYAYAAPVGAYAGAYTPSAAYALPPSAAYYTAHAAASDPTEMDDDSPLSASSAVTAVEEPLDIGYYDLATQLKPDYTVLIVGKRNTGSYACGVEALWVVGLQ